MSGESSSSNSENGYTVELRNLNFASTEEAVRGLFSRYGAIAELFLPRNPNTNLGRGWANVKYHTKTSAIDTAYHLNGEMLDGRIIRVSIPNKKLRKCLKKKVEKQRSSRRTNQVYSVKIENLDYRTDERDLRRKFSRYGRIADIYLPRIRLTSLNRGFAFVRYFKKSHADDAIKYLDDTELNGNRMKVYEAKYGEPPPHRFTYRSNRRY